MLRRWLGVQDSDKLIAGLRRDLEAQVYRLSVYESNIPAMAKVKKAMDEKARRRVKKAEVEAALAAEPVADTPEMAVVAEAAE